jgi:hypothetical protein
VKRDGGAWDDHRGAGVAPHGVKRDANLAWHKSPGNLVWCGLERAGRKMGSPRTWRPVKRHAAPGPGRDNSVLLSRNNLLPPAFCIREHPAADGLIHKKYMKIK